MKLSDYIVDFLAKRNIRYTFVVSGGAIIHTIDSCRKHSDIDYICVQHEQHGAIAADAYSRVTNNMGVVMTTSGPGATNIVTSVCNAYFDSIPMICICGQVSRFRIKKSKKLRQKGFQETDIVSIFKDITKYVVTILDPMMIRYELEKAFYLAKEGRPGPVVLDVPDDIQRLDIDESKLKGFTPPAKQCINLDHDIKILFDYLRSAKKPLFVFGAGVHIANVEDEARKFIEKFKIPCVFTWGAKDLIDNNNRYNCGVFGIYGPRSGNFAIQNSDLIIVLGSRLSQMNTGGKTEFFAKNAKKIVIDVDEEELKKYDESMFVIDFQINVDLSDFLKKINLLNINYGLKNYDEWIKKINSWKIAYPICEDSYYHNENSVNPYVFNKLLSNKLDKDKVIVLDTGANISWFCQSFEVKQGQRIFSAWNHTPMGYSLPASVGAALGTNKTVICMIGDGGLMMCLEELGTVKRYNLPIIIFLFNNAGHGIQKQTMDTWLNSQYSAVNKETGLYFPNYQKIAAAFDIPYYYIKSNLQIENVLEKCLSQIGPIFCDLNITNDQKIIPYLKFGDGLENLFPKLRDDELKEIMYQDS